MRTGRLTVTFPPSFSHKYPAIHPESEFAMKACPAENSDGRNKAGGRKPVMSNMKKRGKPGVGGMKKGGK